MKRVLYILFVLSVLIIGGCRTNNGEIGPFYGEWALRSMTIDGDPSGIDCTRFYFRFQNNIICITETLGLNDFFNAYGTWEKVDDMLLLNFTHTNSLGHEVMFTPSEELLFSYGVINELEINSLNAKTMQLTFITDEGLTVVYSLEKLL